MSQIAFVPNAERKLDGARFFLERLEEDKEDPRTVYHHLGAFLSCARSVSMALEHESYQPRVPENDPRGICQLCERPLRRETPFHKWLKEWLAKLSEDERAVAKRLTGYRDRDVHRDGLPLSVEIDTLLTHSTESMNELLGEDLDAAGGQVWERPPSQMVAPPFASVHPIEIRQHYAQIDPDLPGKPLMQCTYNFTGSDAMPDVITACRRHLEVATRLLLDYRAVSAGAA
ncbi:MAG: hypothetical protein O7H41_11925 [Planctomycetota bacterium]|nr:hypothetical protein [Planctomycetota bacterium]